MRTSPPPAAHAHAPRQGQQGEPERPIEEKVQLPGEEAPDRGLHAGDAVLLRHGGPGLPVKGVQIFLSGEVPVAHMGVPQLPAEAQRLVQLFPL